MNQVEPSAEAATPRGPAPALGGTVVIVPSRPTRARALARVLGGTVQQAGALWRVRTGPYRDLTAAKLGRDAAARRGYGDARILTDP